MPNLRTRPFFTDVPGALPYTYAIPGTVELVIQSIVARFDGAGAGASFVPCLSIYTSDGRLMARARPDQVFAAGDTGVVTWAPFLRRSLRAYGPWSAGINRLAAFTVADNTQTLVSPWDSLNWDNCNAVNLGAAPDRFTIPFSGYYQFSAAVQWEPNNVGYRLMRLEITGPTLGVVDDTTPAVPTATDITYHNISHGAYCKEGAVVRLFVYQNSGAPLDLAFTSPHGDSPSFMFLGQGPPGSGPGI